MEQWVRINNNMRLYLKSSLLSADGIDFGRNVWRSLQWAGRWAASLLWNVFLICFSQGIRIELSNPICTFLALRRSHLLKNGDVMRIYTRCVAVQRAHRYESGRWNHCPALQDYSGRLRAPVATHSNTLLQHSFHYSPCVWRLLPHPYRRWWHPHVKRKFTKGVPWPAETGGGGGGGGMGGKFCEEDCRVGTN